MKKVIPTTWLKAIITLCFLLISLFTSSAQRSDWELGIGLRPLNLKDEPYTIMLKKHISPRVGVRFGLSGLFSSHSKHFDYVHPYPGSVYSFSYKYTLVDTRLYMGALVGAQYKIGKIDSRFFWYGASDLYLRYHLEKPDVPAGVHFPLFMMRPGDYIVAAEYDQRKSIIIGGRQSLGIQYFLTNTFSISAEGGFFYETSFSKVTHFLFAGLYDETIGNGIIVEPGNWRKYRDFKMGFSPVMQLSFNCHF